MSTPRVHIIVQARTGSTRLPGKVLMDIAGRPSLEQLLLRLARVRGVEGVVLATTELERDDPVAEIGARMGVSVHRGSEDDVLGRYYHAAVEAGSDVVVRVCADNPLTDPETIELCLEQYFSRRLDYLHAFQDVQVPYGTGCAVFSRDLLAAAHAQATDAEDREHVEPWMQRADGVAAAAFRAPAHLRRPDIHVSVDYPSDFDKVSRVFEACHSRDPEFGTVHVIEELDRCPLVVCANGTLGRDLVRFLVEHGEDIRGLVVHPIQESRCREEIIALTGLTGDDVISPESLDEPWVHRWFAERAPELVVSFWSSYIVPPEILTIPPRGVVNLHNSLLPWCRGSGANVWTILEGNPGGVTIHYMAKEVDRGGIIAQRDVPVDSSDTGKTLFAKLEAALVALFEEEWPRVRVGPVRTTPQAPGGSFHFRKSAHEMREIDLDAPTTAREVIDRLRAFSFSPYPGAWFRDENGERVHLHLELSRGIGTVAKDAPIRPAAAPPRPERKTT